MAVTQLFKSEVSLILSNAAAGLDKNRSELLWDTEDRSFIVANRTKVSLPGIEKKKNAAQAIHYPAGMPENAVVKSLLSSLLRHKRLQTWPILMGLISKIFDDSAFSQKLRSVTDMLCQLSDAEAVAQVWPDNVYFCFIEDLVGALLICGESEQDVNCEETIDEYKHTKEDFPAGFCEIAPDSVYANLIPSRFKFSDPQLSLPVLFVDLLGSTAEHRLPTNISSPIIQQEALTYLTLFRALMIASSFSRKPYLCGAGAINPPVLIPGWNLPLVINLREEGDPIFKEKGLVRDSIPLIFVSQSKDAPCSFVIAIRGTASMWEWTQDFEYWQVGVCVGLLSSVLRFHSHWTQISWPTVALHRSSTSSRLCWKSTSSRRPRPTTAPAGRRI